MSLLFYYYPITCATAAHIILRESELAFESQLVNLRNGQQHEQQYRQTNPKGSVPALFTENSLLTENQAILTFIADQVPHKHLIPATGTFERAQAHQWMNYCAASIHPAIRSVFRPAAYAGDDSQAQQAVKAHGLASLLKYGNYVEQHLDASPWALGEHFTVVDAYLYIMYLWSRDKRMENLADFPKWRQLTLKVHDRPSTQDAIKMEMAGRTDYRLPAGFALEAS